MVQESSVQILIRAAEAAEGAGERKRAGLALLTLLEEHGATPRLRPDEVYKTYLRADGLLRDTHDGEEIARLRACARVVMRRLTTPQFGEQDFTLYGAVREVEAQLIEGALEEAGGSLVGAARLLGVTHQTLGSMLNSRHKQLADKRRPPQKRRKSISRKPAK